MQINLCDYRENGENIMRWLLVSNLPVIQTEPEETFPSDLLEIEKVTGGTTVWPFILLGLVISVLIAVIIVLLILFLKNKKTGDNDISQTVSKPSLQIYNDSSAHMNPKEEKGYYNMDVQDRNSAIYPEIILINVNKPDYIYRARITDRVIIGRGEGADIRIVTDPAVSSRHCIISVKGTQFYLEDCNSSNGTRYNDQQVTLQIPIMSGGILEIGHDVYRLMIGN